MLDILKDLYVSGYRFYIKNDILFLDSKNVSTPKNFTIKKIKEDPSKKEEIKKEVKQFKTIKLGLNGYTINAVTTLINNASIEVINLDYNISNKTIIFVFKINGTIDKRDSEYIKLLEEVSK